MSRVTLRQVLFLSAAFDALGYNNIPTELRVKVRKLRKSMDTIISDFNDDKLLIILANDGVESEKQKGIIPPQFPTRDKFAGTDEKFAEELKSISEKQKNIRREIDSLLDSYIDFGIEPIMSQEQFNEVGEELNDLRWVELEHVLVDITLRKEVTKENEH